MSSMPAAAAMSRAISPVTAKVWQTRARLSAVPPLMAQAPAHPGGHRNKGFDDRQA